MKLFRFQFLGRFSYQMPHLNSHFVNNSIKKANWRFPLSVSICETFLFSSLRLQTKVSHCSLSNFGGKKIRSHVGAQLSWTDARVLINCLGESRRLKHRQLIEQERQQLSVVRFAINAAFYYQQSICNHNCQWHDGIP